MDTTARAIAASLLDVVDAQLTALSDGPLPRFQLPGLLMGHEVGPDVRADLLFTLGLAHDCGHTHIGGRPVVDAIGELLAGVQGKRTHTFFSYRVAETVGRFGPFTDNTVLAPLTPAQRDDVALATDSLDWLELLDEGLLPRNYAAVLARCEHARQSLGLVDHSSALDDLLDRVRDLLGGYLDDSNGQIGRYDVYTVDIYLFCEPLAHLLGEPWRDGAMKAMELVDRVASRDGAAVAWGRSTGVLALCHTVELGGLVARYGLSHDPQRWFARAALAAARVDEWFEAGWVLAHRHRSSDPYRGLDRRLQMSLDCLGKLADAARGFQTLGDLEITFDEEALWPDRDEVVWFDRERNAGVWSFRSRGNGVHAPARRRHHHRLPPGTAQSGAPRGTRRIRARHRHTPPAAQWRALRGWGSPRDCRSSTSPLHATYRGFPEAGHLEPALDGPSFAGTRDVTWSVDGRTLRVPERLEFDQAPHALALQVAEPADRPLQVHFECDAPHSTATVDVDGIAEYRSCWGELSRLHQIDVRPTTSVRLQWEVTPVLRVVSTAVGALYNDSLYAPLAGRVRVQRLPYAATTDRAALDRLVPTTDQLHMHWPEWLLIGGIDPHRALIDGLRAAACGSYGRSTILFRIARTSTWDRSMRRGRTRPTS